MSVDSSAIDAALVGKLLADAPLMAILVDGIYFDEAPQGATRFLIISLVDEVDTAMFGGRMTEDALYLIKAVALASTGADVKTAAARIDAVLEDQPLAASGYGWMTVHRESRIRLAEVDDVDPAIRWQHRGGQYRVTMSVS